MNIKIKIFTGLCMALCVGFISKKALAENHFGIKAAMNTSGLSDMKLGSNADQTMRWSFAGGLFFNHELNSLNSIHIEGLYSLQGGEIRWDKNPDEVYRLNYLNVPIYYRHHFKENSAFSIQIGLQPGYLVSAKRKIIGDDAPATELQTHLNSGNQDIELNKFDIGISGGLGFGFGMFSSITLTYTYGLIPVFKGQDAPNSVKNSLIQFGLCIPLTSNTY